MRWKRRKSSSPPSPPCRSPISTASRKVPGIKVYANGYEALTYQLVVEINHRRKELADVRVRRAIAHAIDRDFVVKTIFLGYAKAATGPVPAYDKTFYEPDVHAISPSIRRRRTRLLDEAGYPRGEDGTRFSAETAAGAVLQRDEAVRRLSARRRWPRSASTRRSCRTIRRRI